MAGHGNLLAALFGEAHPVATAPGRKSPRPTSRLPRRRGRRCRPSGRSGARSRNPTRWAVGMESSRSRVSSAESSRVLAFLDHQFRPADRGGRVDAAQIRHNPGINQPVVEHADGRQLLLDGKPWPATAAAPRRTQGSDQIRVILYFKHRHRSASALNRRTCGAPAPSPKTIWRSGFLVLL